MTTVDTNASLGIHGDERDKKGRHEWNFFRTEVVDYQQELLYQSRGPWPTPAPGRPLSEYAEVCNIPEEEQKDWNTNVRNFYLKTLILKFIPGLWWAYVKSGGRYHHFDDAGFNQHLSGNMYSKFFSDLDIGDADLFADKVPEVKNNPQAFVKMDFSCIDWICTKTIPGTYVAASIVLFKKTAATSPDATPSYHVQAIYLYQTNDQHEVIGETADVLLPEDGDRWELAKYFALQGAVHRVNMTEHGRLHFPFDAVNAITKSVLPVKHPLFRLLIPHLRLSLPVDNSVLEGAYSLLSRVNWVVYSPFTAEGKYTRKLIPDGYVGRAGKPNAFPPYLFSTKPHYPDTSFGIYLRKNYDAIYKFAKAVIKETLPGEYAADDKSGIRRNWELIALWASAVSEWVPDFPQREDFLPDPNPSGIVLPNRELLIGVVAYTIWDLTIAHAADHIGFGAAGPLKNVFRIRCTPPLKGQTVDPNFQSTMVKPWDLFQSLLAHELFYTQHNTTTLQGVQYDFSGLTNEIQLNQLRDQFIKDLKRVDAEEHARDPNMPRLEHVAASIQY